MRFRFPLCVFTSGFFLTSALLIGSARNQPLATIEAALESHHVELTKTGLLNALRDRDPEVRWLAAQKLAADKARDAVPAIREALDKDWSVPQNRVNIALALAQLEVSKGFETLEAACVDPGLNPSTRLLAAGYMLDLGKHSCLKGVMDAIDAHDDPGAQMQAFSLLPRYEPLSAGERTMVLQLVVKSLADPTSAVRMSAATALAAIGDRGSLEALRSAIARESESAVREHLQLELRILEARK